MLEQTKALLLLLDKKVIDKQGVFKFMENSSYSSSVCEIGVTFLQKQGVTSEEILQKTNYHIEVVKKLFTKRFLTKNADKLAIKHNFNKSICLVAFPYLSQEMRLVVIKNNPTNSSFALAYAKNGSFQEKVDLYFTVFKGKLRGKERQFWRDLSEKEVMNVVELLERLPEEEDLRPSRESDSESKHDKVTGFTSSYVTSVSDIQYIVKLMKQYGWHGMCTAGIHAICTPDRSKDDLFFVLKYMEKDYIKTFWHDNGDVANAVVKCILLLYGSTLTEAEQTIISRVRSTITSYKHFEQRSDKIPTWFNEALVSVPFKSDTQILDHVRKNKPSSFSERQIKDFFDLLKDPKSIFELALMGHADISVENLRNYVCTNLKRQKVSDKKLLSLLRQSPEKEKAIQLIFASLDWKSYSPKKVSTLLQQSGYNIKVIKHLLSEKISLGSHDIISTLQKYSFKEEVCTILLPHLSDITSEKKMNSVLTACNYALPVCMYFADKLAVQDCQERYGNRFLGKA